MWCKKALNLMVLKRKKFINCNKLLHFVAGSMFSLLWPLTCGLNGVLAVSSNGCMLHCFCGIWACICVIYVVYVWIAWEALYFCLCTWLWWWSRTGEALPCGTPAWWWNAHEFTNHRALSARPSSKYPSPCKTLEVPPQTCRRYNKSNSVR